MWQIQPAAEEEEEELSLCSLRVCDAETQTDGTEVEDDNEFFLFFFPPKLLLRFLLAVTAATYQEELPWFS